MHNLKIRSDREELMDTPDLDPKVFASVLADLARVNRWTLTARPTLRFLRRAAGGLTSFSLLDVGFGHGDMLRAIARWAARRGIEARLVGVDINPLSKSIARRATHPELGPESGIDFRTGDYRDQDDGFDFIVSSQVAHHMSEAQLGDFLRHMEATARRGWLVSDLHRHRLPHAAFPVLARIMGVHRIVREDGTLSIARAFRPDEWPGVLARAGIPLASVRILRHFPWRITVERTR